jgi:hypothetical protein
VSRWHADHRQALLGSFDDLRPDIGRDERVRAVRSWIPAVQPGEQNCAEQGR